MLEILSGIAGVLLSLLFSYIPGAKDWFDKLTGQYKRLIMVGLLALSALAVYGLSCGGFAEYIGVKITCGEAGAIELFRAFLAAFVANQSAYVMTPDKKAGAEDQTPVR